MNLLFSERVRDKSEPRQGSGDVDLPSEGQSTAESDEKCPA